MHSCRSRHSAAHATIAATPIFGVLTTAPTPSRGGLTRTVLAVLLILVLTGSSLWILRPFLLAIVWAAMIVVATWPLMLRLQGMVRGRGLAVAIMSARWCWCSSCRWCWRSRRWSTNTDTIERVVAYSGDRPDSPSARMARPRSAGGREARRSLGGHCGVGQGEPCCAGCAVCGSGGAVAGRRARGLRRAGVPVPADGDHRGGHVHAGRSGARRPDPVRPPLVGDRGECRRAAGQGIRAVALGVVVTALAQRLWRALASPWREFRLPGC